MESITTTPSHPHSPHSPLPQSADGCPLGLRWFPHSRSPRPAPSPEVSHFLIGKLWRIHFHAVLFAVNFSLTMSLRICCANTAVVHKALCLSLKVVYFPWIVDTGRAKKFYLFRSDELSSKRKKAEPFARKNGRKAPQREKYLISGFGYLRCSARENSGLKSPQTRMKPEKNGTTSILSSRYGRWQQNRYRSNRERRGKRKGRAQDAKCVQAQPGGAGEGNRTPVFSLGS